jgi:hypothetical protein
VGLAVRVLLQRLSFGLLWASWARLLQCCKLASAEHEKQAVIKQQYGISWPLLLLQPSGMQVGIVVHAEHTVITCFIPRSRHHAQSS